MRKRSVTLTRQDLERSDPNESREVSALVHNIRQLVREAAELRSECDHLAAAWRGERARADQATRELIEVRQDRGRLRSSRSRRLFEVFRGIRGRPSP